MQIVAALALVSFLLLAAGCSAQGIAAAAHRHEPGRLSISTPGSYPPVRPALAIGTECAVGILRRHDDRLEASFTQLTRFHPDIAHELRGPINNLISAASVTQKQSSAQQLPGHAGGHCGRGACRE